MVFVIAVPSSCSMADPFEDGRAGDERLHIDNMSDLSSVGSWMRLRRRHVVDGRFRVGRKQIGQNAHHFRDFG